jgi:hypothetical protein
VNLYPLRRPGVDRPPPGTADSEASLVAFDLLGLAGVEGLVFSEAIEGEGALVFAHACKLGLEGIVAKRKGGLYRSGTSRSWLKCRNPEFVRT